MAVSYTHLQSFSWETQGVHKSSPLHPVFGDFFNLFSWFYHLLFSRIVLLHVIFFGRLLSQEACGLHSTDCCEMFSSMLSVWPSQLYFPLLISFSIYFFPPIGVPVSYTHLDVYKRQLVLRAFYLLVIGFTYTAV